MSYWRYWQLDCAPFGTDAADRLFCGATVEEALARIDFLVSHRRRVGTLVGPSGVGKSRVLRHIASNRQGNPSVPNLCAIKTSMLGLKAGDLTCELAGRLTGGRVEHDPIQAWVRQSDFFAAASRENLHVVLLVDDAESCIVEAEGDLTRLLSKTFPLTIILAIESQLVGAVSRQLLDRTELQIELPGWEESQTAEFLAWTLQSLGRKEPIFTDTAVRRIQQLSMGVARRIVQLADLALVAGAVSQSDFVDADCIDQVAWELPKSNAA